MIEISVIIDCSGSMSVLAKNDIIQSVCRNLLLHEGFEFKFYSWSDSVEEIPYGDEGLSLAAGGKSSLSKLAGFIQNKNQKNILLLTDGFIDEDAGQLRDLIGGTEGLNFRLLGIGADFNEVMAECLLPKNLTAAEKGGFLFNPLDLEAVLESFSSANSDGNNL